eukprot:2197318-Prymnesium_polylepis.1
MVFAYLSRHVEYSERHTGSRALQRAHGHDMPCDASAEAERHGHATPIRHKAVRCAVFQPPQHNQFRAQRISSPYSCLVRG